ncbi:MAG: CoA pyrophosphatase [Chloroflexi bacterium]|nr:CoA pyrophosphatase [Chloroflexota bacterium]
MINTPLTINRLEAVLRSHSVVDDGGVGGSTRAAVTVLFNMHNDEPCVLMIKRASTLNHHSGEWAFPGGMIEQDDESAMHAALRETKEELGVDARDIDVWCGMAPVDTSTGFEVWPFTGRVVDQVELTPFAAEVAEVVNVPVRVFADEAYRRSISVMRNGGVRSMIAYAYEGRIIWGASARIISNAIDVVNGAARQSWTEDRN